MLSNIGFLLQAVQLELERNVWRFKSETLEEQNAKKTEEIESLRKVSV